MNEKELMRTAKDWLAYGDELGLELAEILTPGPSEHHWGDGGRCFKCHINNINRLADEPCPVPAPITIDWNTAMEWFRKTDGAQDCIWEIFQIFREPTIKSDGPLLLFGDWLTDLAQPKHYLIAAAMAVERK